MIDRKTVLKALKHAVANEDEINASEECGCFHCLEVFPKDEIEEFVDGEDGMSAVCPKCSVESVIGDAAGFPLTEELLDAMRQEMFV
jgi:hypothetical protein